MATLDSLPRDQRAVLQLVLGRGRSYDEIARLLSIDPGAVRERALAALDALGPQTKVPADRRALITDYLLGQLPEDEIDPVRDRLAESPSDRAWARVLSSELASVASGPLPEIPTETSSARAAQQATPPPPRAQPPRAEPPPLAELDSTPDAARQPRSPRERRRRRQSREPQSETKPKPSGAPRSSRVGGAVVIGAAIVIVALVLFVVLHSGGSSKHSIAAKPAASSTAAAASTSTSATSSAGSTTAKVIAQINLTPTAAGSKSAGIAEVLSEGATDGIAIVAQHVAPNTTSPPNAYAVWLYNSPSDAHILGFVNPGVTSTGRLSTAGGLPTNASHYKQLIVTQETSANPKVPGQIILQGTLTGL